MALAGPSTLAADISTLFVGERDGAFKSFVQQAVDNTFNQDVDSEVFAYGDVFL